VHSTAAILLTAFVLGLVHGITPDEHTWPITFSYAVGSYSTRRGLLTGLIFSLAFTLERSVASQLSNLALGRFFLVPGLNNYVYLAVGFAMAVAGAHILRFDRALHLHLRRDHHEQHRPEQELALRPPTPLMAAVHGVLAGFGFGAFALVLYTALAPAMPHLLGWAPGALFGLGTMVVQAAAGAAFGAYSRRIRLPAAAAERLAHGVAGKTLAYGGLAFMAGGALGILMPRVAGFSLPTGLRIPNLDAVNLGLVLVVVTVLGIGIGSLWTGLRQARSVRPEREPA
jgi:hypothetical protein